MAPEGPQPDLVLRNKLKAKYFKIQRRYFRALDIRRDLEIEAQEKDDKLCRLQDEIDLIIDQIYNTDYKHLEPAEDDLFSDDDGTESQAPGARAPNGSAAVASGSGTQAHDGAPVVKPDEEGEADARAAALAHARSSPDEGAQPSKKRRRVEDDFVPQLPTAGETFQGGESR